MSSFMNASIHGLRFLVDPTLHWSERLFWVVSIIFSWYLSTQLALASLSIYKHNPITFVVETTFINWKTDFPSVVVCESENNEKIEEASDFLWSPNHDFNLEEVLKEIAFFKGVSYYIQKFCNNADSDPNCPKSNFSYYAGRVRSKCNEMLQNCTWNEDFFDCCEYFLPMETEMGICYGVNSMQTWNPRKKVFPMVSDRKSGPGTLLFSVLATANVYVLSPEEVPTLTTLPSDIVYVIGQQRYRRHISVKNMENDVQVRDINTDTRHCRYPNEDPLSVYPYYSYSACTVECRKVAQLATCSCTSFFSPNTPQKYHCDSKGLACLHENYNLLSVLKAKWSTRSGLYCNCLPSCEEQEITIIDDGKINVEDDTSAVVEIMLDFLPNERNRRRIVRGPIDLVVSIGGTVVLFIGASMLSLVEIPYFIFRYLETKGNKRKQRQMSQKALITKKPQKSTLIMAPGPEFYENRVYIPRKLYNVNRSSQRINNDIINRRYTYGRLENTNLQNRIIQY